MKKEEPEKQWRKLSEEVIEGTSAWRKKHPKATMREIEEEIDKRMSEMRARMITDTALNSVSTEWKAGENAAVCPTCGVALKQKGKKKRKLETREGREIELEREYGVCPKCGQGIFPLDEELEILPGKLTPKGHEQLVGLSSWMPFRQAVKMFAEFTGVQVSKIVSQCRTEKAGAIYEQIQKEEVEGWQKKMPRARVKPEKLQVSADGANVPLVHGSWAEVRTLVIGDVQPAVQEKGEAVVHTRNLSYFSRKVNSQEFERLSLVEIHRRGVENAKEVAAVMDGAEWLQSLTDYHCPRAVRILDFAHAADHIRPIGEFLYGEHTDEGRAWLRKHLHQLKHEGPRKLLLAIQKLQRKHAEVQVIASNLAYLKKREIQMQYPIFQAQGWPIGSGIVESGNKLVVEARLKGSGMHWAERHVNSMLAMRNIICSDRWKEEWPKIESGIRKQKLKKPLPLPPKVISGKEALLLILKEKMSSEDDSSAVTLEPKKPKSNPWRNFKHGKALYQRKEFPKL